MTTPSAASPPALTEGLSHDLAVLVGSAHVLHDAGARARYTLDGVAPSLVVRPATLEELSGTLRLLHAAGLAMVPLGTGSHGEVGQIPRRYDVALLTWRMQEIVEYDPDDLTACVQAGARFVDFQRRLAQHEQWLALDPAATSESTVGGVFAGSRIGPRRMSTGSPRDKVLGVTAVLADGTVVRSGGRVVKNVSGYDLHRLYTGSQGALAVLAQIHVRLSAAPQARRTQLFTAGALADAEELLLALRTSRLELSALELLDVPCARAADARGAGLPWRAQGEENTWTVAALYEGSSALVTEQVEAGGRLAAAARKPAVLEGARSEAFWSAVSGLGLPSGSSLSPDGRSRLYVRASVLPADVARLAGEWRAHAVTAGLSAQVHAHAGSGHIHLKLTGASLDALEDCWARVGLDLENAEGTAEVIDAPTYLKARVPLWFGSSGPPALMKSLKDTFDPLGLLSPGRMPYDTEAAS